jgi:glutathione S-transferase
VRYERTLRPEPLVFAPWIAGQMSKIGHALTVLETEVDSLKAALTIGTIAVGCALGYLDLRFPEEKWQGRHPKLAAFWHVLSERQSFKATTPEV